jgi:hypothetical protein
VHLAKIQKHLGSSGDVAPNTGGDYSYSKVLKSRYLIDVYPKSSGEVKPNANVSVRAQDEYLFSCRAHSQLTSLHDVLNDNFGRLTHIEIEKKEK